MPELAKYTTSQTSIIVEESSRNELNCTCEQSNKLLIHWSDSPYSYKISNKWKKNDALINSV